MPHCHLTILLSLVSSHNVDLRMLFFGASVLMDYISVYYLKCSGFIGDVDIITGDVDMSPIKPLKLMK